jgi:3-hydroxyacyl-CoA dehydrogenase
MRKINKVAILGSGVMGSRIACHFANIGVDVILLDIVPKKPTDIEAEKGLSIKDKIVRDRIVNEALNIAIKTNPSPLYKKSDSKKIAIGNFEDDLQKIEDCDWTIEVVIENLAIKKSVFDQIEQHRKPGTLITSNTSGIPIHSMLTGRSDDFKKTLLWNTFFQSSTIFKTIRNNSHSENRSRCNRLFNELRR